MKSIEQHLSTPLVAIDISHNQKLLDRYGRYETIEQEQNYLKEYKHLDSVIYLSQFGFSICLRAK